MKTEKTIRSADIKSIIFNLLLKLIVVSAILIVPLALTQIQAAISFSPPQPNVEQTVTFLVSHPAGIIPASVVWNFGDGSQASGSTTATKAYRTIGNFIVRVTYTTLTQQQVNEQTPVTVVERRRITTNPPLYPAVNKPVEFRAENFLAKSVLWNFGDGTRLVLGPEIISHVYSSPGKYTVEAKDFGGESVAKIQTTVNVTEGTGPRASFQVFFLQLRFDDGKPYKVVPRGYDRLVAYADIKYEGSGILNALWLVNGIAFRVANLSLPFARQTIINSGSIPALPTAIPGMYEVSLKIIQPQVEFEIPVIRYFVAADKSLDRFQLNQVTVDGFKSFDLEGKELEISQGLIQAPARKHILFRGKIKNIKQTLVPFALLRIYLNSNLVDQQVLKDLKPGEVRPFESSIFNPGSADSSVYIVLYDISVKPETLLFIEKYELKSDGN